ncbi:hypothetical protein [Pedobacter montanisoli]|uniref:Uncharacterized protein n=1 Tax=Pedobacter montanisoli TaxID=2923277 RepID=A0ABS9ZSM4_9SPHI|nr:hypothetical protein [Pedobacter montanisoli]MCJ0741571.1 hypothetical protein [Pedobacter montanisoli]
MILMDEDGEKIQQLGTYKNLKANNMAVENFTGAKVHIFTLSNCFYTNN